MIAPTKERVERKLEKSGRITPREVLEAYEETGLEPAENIFVLRNKACAFGAVMVREGVPRVRGVLDESEKKAWLTRRMRRLGPTYALGFYEGFDGAGSMGLVGRLRKGYRDAQRVRRFVEARYGMLS
jgi:hypothetical protein